MNTPTKTPVKNGNEFNLSTVPSTTKKVNFMNVELLQAKVEHLEKERLELSLHLHNRSERERSYKIKIEQLENNIKAGEDAKKKLAIEITKLTSENHLLRSEKSELQDQVGKLTREVQSVNHFETKDLWSKMTNLSSELKRIEKELVSNNIEKSNLQKENTKLSLEIQISTERLSLLGLEINELKTRYDDLLQNHTQLQLVSSQQQEKCEEYERQISSLTEENSSILTKMSEITERNVQILEQTEALTAQLKERDDIIAQHAKEDIQGSEVSKRCDNDEGITALQQEIIELKEKLFHNERKRKSLHNQLQEYKGNIRVLVRCRPYLSSDNEEESQQFLLFHEDKASLSVLNPSSRHASQQYTFDQVFQPTANQEDIYREVTDLVQSVTDGYRVCIFSYGQTGSGKTFTMTGEKQGRNRGIIPRAFEELVWQSKQLIGSGWETSIQVSIVELYNEEFRDLLCPPPPSDSRSREKDPKTKIKVSYQNNRTVISGLTTSSISMEDEEAAVVQFHELLDRSNQSRTTASTNMNEFSSRSHLIVLIDFIGKHNLSTHESSNPSTRRQSALPSMQPQTVILGGLKLCDLAGSERLDRTQTLHDSTRLKETVNINKSLSCLSDVFAAINNKQSHVPFRNSKLTMLLQDCLSGDGKSLMFVNISPTQASLNETLCSLRFANQVSQVELGKAQKSIFTSAVPQLANLLLPPSVHSAPPVPPVSTSNTGPQPATSSIPSSSSSSAINKVSSSAITRTTLPLNSSDIVTNRPFTRRSSLSHSRHSASVSATGSENVPENILMSERSEASIVPLEVDQKRPCGNSSHNSQSQTMNDKLQHYLTLKQRNLGTSQRRGSVLPSSSSLANPSRTSFLPPSHSQSALDTSTSFLGKRDLLQLSHSDRSFVIDSTSWAVKKPKTDLFRSSDHSSRKSSWR